MSPVERVRLNESGWRVRLNESGWVSLVERVRLKESGLMSPFERVWLNESGWTSPVERVRLNESGWTSPVERVRLNDSNDSGVCHVSHCLRIAAFGGPSDCGSHRPRIVQTADHRSWSLPLIFPLIITPTADRSVRRTHWLWFTSFAYRTDCGSPYMITLADPSVDDHSLWSFRWWSHPLRITAFGWPTDCGSHCPHIVQTVDHRRWSLTLIFPLMITSTADHSGQRTHWLWITPSTYRTDCGSPSMITLADPSVHDHTDCGSQRSADPLTVDHTVRVSHRLRITVDYHSRWSFRRRSRAVFLDTANISLLC